jgi:hypothetical protein
MKITKILVFILLLAMVHHSFQSAHKKSRVRSILSAVSQNASNQNTTDSKMKAIADGIINLFIKKDIGTFKNIGIEGYCTDSEDDGQIDFSLLPQVGINFRSIFRTLSASTSDPFKLCYGEFKGSYVSWSIGYNVPICSRLFIANDQTYSIIAYNLVNSGCGSLCLAFDETGTVSFSMDETAVSCLNNLALFGLDIQGAVLAKIASILNSPVDFGVSVARRLQTTITLPFINSNEMVELGESTFNSQFSFFLPKNLNPLQFSPLAKAVGLFASIPPQVLQAVSIPIEVPVLVDFGPNATSRNLLINTVFGSTLNVENFMKGFANTEVVASVTGSIIIKIANPIGFPNPLELRTKNLGVLLKTSNDDFGNGFKEAGVYLSIPPEAQEQLHEFVRNGLKLFKIYIPERPSLKFGLMLTTKRFGWILELPNNNIKWTCNVPWGLLGPDLLNNKNCALYIGQQ